MLFTWDGAGSALQTATVCPSLKNDTIRTPIYTLLEACAACMGGLFDCSVWLRTRSHQDHCMLPAGMPLLGENIVGPPGLLDLLRPCASQHSYVGLTEIAAFVYSSLPTPCPPLTVRSTSSSLMRCLHSWMGAYPGARMACQFYGVTHEDRKHHDDHVSWPGSEKNHARFTPAAVTVEPFHCFLAINISNLASLATGCQQDPSNIINQVACLLECY